jgi:hypothetical protein
VTRQAWTSAAQRLDGDRGQPTGTREKISADGGARNAVARPHSTAHGGVDGGVDGFGHSGDGFRLGDGVASDSGGSAVGTSEARRRMKVWTAAAARSKRRCWDAGARSRQRF